MRLLILLLTISISSLSVCAQTSLEELHSSISYHSDIVANAALESSRLKANKMLVNDLESFFDQENSFDVDFGEDVWLSVKSPDAKDWRIITWELKKDEAGSEFYGYIQMNDGSVVLLKDHSDDMDDVEYLSLDASYWYGALYYNMIEQADTDGDKYFILLGYDHHDKFTNRKIADVLTFKDGQPIFGKEIFNGTEEDSTSVLSRLFIEYGSDANVSLNYNPALGLIVFDHLIGRMGQLPGQGPTYYPDGSYCGYKPAEDGTWKYVDKLYDQISATAPRPKPVLGKKNKKDLFGKKN
ncbi:MAG: hypothetical protein HKN68_21495 [Saprospiraceae bacterium]|nr:hypothetical protein [Saprospiraceae bacterium]